VKIHRHQTGRAVDYSAKPRDPVICRFRLARAGSVVFAVVIIAALFALVSETRRGAAQTEGGASIVGVIQDDRGQPVADVKVTISSITTTASTLTSADGRFEFRNLKAGQYQVIAEAARFRKEKIIVILSRPDEAATPPPIRLSPSALHVTVLDSNNQPLAGVAVAVSPRERAATEPQVERRSTDEGGDAYFSRLAPGSYQLTATLRGFDEYRNDVFISSGITTEFAVQLTVAPLIPINEKAITRYGLPGLPSKNVTAVFQDAEGWIWIGTDRGVARFNGTDFQSSSTAGSPYEVLAGDEIRAITQGPGGVIWIATAEAVRRIYPNGTDAGEQLAIKDIRSVLADGQGRIWIASSNGLVQFEGRDPKPVSPAPARSVAVDRSGRVWVATDRGLALLEQDHLRPVEMTSAPNLTAARDALPTIRQIFIDRNDAIWLATERGAFYVEPSAVGQPALKSPGGIHPDATGGGVRAISQDSRGRLWFALEAGGVLLYDAERAEFQRIGFLERDRVTAMLPSREGNLWFGSDNGAVQSDLYSFVSFTASRGLPDNEVNAVSEMPKPPGGDAAQLWVFTATGVSRMEEDRFVPVEGFKSNINVHDVAVDASGSAWFATGQGALKLSGKTLTQLNEASGLPSNNVHCVESIAGGHSIAFGTSRGACILTGTQTSRIPALAGYDVRHVYEDSDGSLWFSTARGALRLGPGGAESETIDVERGLADNDVRWITQFGGKLLIASRGGIQSYDRNRGRQALTVFDGDGTTALFVDSDGYLWSGTDEGQLKKFVQSGGQVVSATYSGEATALAGSQINSISQDAAGDLWIATNRGAIRHRPIRLKPTVDVALEVDGRPYARSEYEPVEVSYGRHRFTFRFSAVSAGGATRYLYRVNPQGADVAWKSLSAQQSVEREVSLLDLDEGGHSFELIALNRDLYGADAPAARIALRVGLPFWKRWWFFTAFALSVGLVAVLILAVRRLQNREYELPRELRTFVPIEPNPYIVGNPIRTEAMFYGRQDDFRYVRTKLEGANQGVVIVFCGERRVGKSSILYQLQNGRLGERFIPVFVDLQEMVISSDAELFARMSRLISEAVARAQASVAEPAAAELAGAAASLASAATGAPQPAPTAPAPLSVPRFDASSNPYPLFLDFLDQVLGSIGDRTLLILMDEYELLESKVDEGKLSSEFFTFLAGLMDNRERLALIFTGSRRLEDRDRKYWRELLRRSLYRKVGFLSQNDALRLIAEPVSGRAVYGKGVVNEIYRLTAGQPFYTQMLCQNTVDHMNENRQNWVTSSDLQKVIGEVVDHPLPQMIYTWDALSDDEKLVLSLLAESLVDGSAYASAHDLRTSVRLNDYPVNLSETTIRMTLEEMFRRELLEKDSADGFRFRIDLLRVWIRRSHSIWQVVKEVRTR
jgi:ligand-binding sensor domain-containing protein